MTAVDFDAQASYQLHPHVSLRDEAFGAMAYHHVTRRLVFLKSRDLVATVRALGSTPDAADAVAANRTSSSASQLYAALAALLRSDIIRVRS